MSAVLQVEGLSGGYNIRKPVIHELNFSIQAGEMFGLIGLNGAGKSTTIKHILGLLQAQKGTIRIHGQTLEENMEAYRGAYAYVPESPLLYDELTVKEHMELAAMAYGVERTVCHQRMGPLLERFQMTDKVDALPALLSKGMRQKVMIMNAFIVEPDLYIIDEPFLGLDPLGIRHLLELMVEKQRQGAAILMSSHILSTIEKYCDGYLILHRGRLVAQGNLHDVQQQAGLENAALEDVFYELIEGEGAR